jgi:hypothetical protein
MAAKSSAGARILVREEVRVLGIPNLAGAAAPPRPNIDPPLLRELRLINVQHLACVENFPSLVKLWSYDNPMLERISNNTSLQWIGIGDCRALKELDGLPSLRSLEWWDWVAEALPEYLREAKLKKLRVDCSRSSLKLIALRDESTEWGKIQHGGRVVHQLYQGAIFLRRIPGRAHR